MKIFTFFRKLSYYTGEYNAPESNFSYILENEKREKRNTRLIIYLAPLEHWCNVLLCVWNFHLVSSFYVLSSVAATIANLIFVLQYRKPILIEDKNVTAGMQDFFKRATGRLPKNAAN